MRGGLLAVAFLLLPLAQASHPPAGVLVSHGVVLTADGPAPAALSFRPCEGVTQVAVSVETPSGRRQDHFDAFLEFLAPPHLGFLDVQGCLGDFLPPAVVFRLANATIATEFHGVIEIGTHFIPVAGASGEYRGQASAFAWAAA